MSETLAEVFENLKQRYKAGVVEAPTTIYFSLGDEAAQKWTMTLTPSGCEVVPGKQEGSDVVLKTSEDLFRKMLKGEYTPGFTDFAQGKIKTNDPTKLPLLKQCFG